MAAERGRVSKAEPAGRRALTAFGAGARRFLQLLVGVAVSTAIVSLALGLAFGASVSRALSVGFYVAGCFLVVMGFFLGNRGPARPKGNSSMLLFGRRSIRWATREEHEDALNSSAVFVVLGFALIAIGAIADTRYRLF